MSRLSKLTIGVGVVSGVLLAAWLLTGNRKEKTKKFISKGTATLTKTLKRGRNQYDDSEVHYI